MANDIREIKIPIMLDKGRTLIFDFNAFAEIDEMYGDYKKGLAALGTGSLKTVRAFLWAGLVHEDKDLTVEKLGSLLTSVDPEYIIGLSEKILQAAKGNLGEVKN
ncbi:hypothetical protein J2T13_000877 [Paenibacillus sp. DS2015]|uniref:hypothetical protein n=1 Tax=Paenibacillus sp. DS2015 TaxID=3373917 RepID=UPI003D250EC5